jgi:hypothetical protein
VPDGEVFVPWSWIEGGAQSTPKRSLAGGCVGKSKRDEEISPSSGRPA